MELHVNIFEMTFSCINRLELSLMFSMCFRFKMSCKLYHLRVHFSGTLIAILDIDPDHIFYFELITGCYGAACRNNPAGSIEITCNLYNGFPNTVSLPERVIL